jgi:hypothetical protein
MCAGFFASQGLGQDHEANYLGTHRCCGSAGLGESRTRGDNIIDQQNSPASQARSGHHRVGEVALALTKFESRLIFDLPNKPQRRFRVGQTPPTSHPLCDYLRRHEAALFETRSVTWHRHDQVDIAKWVCGQQSVNHRPSYRKLILLLESRYGSGHPLI